MYNNDHVLAIAGEATVNYGAGGLGYLLADQLSDNVSLSTNNAQTFLTGFYNNAFGPAATAVEDYTVLFDGTAADPNLSSPPTTVSFNGSANGPDGVNNDNSILQQAFGYLNTANSALNTAYNSGHNSSFTTAQFNADQARLQQLQMYSIFLFDQYQLEADSVKYNYSKSNPPAVNSAIFNTLLNDLTNEVSWVDQLSFTSLVDTDAFMIEYTATFAQYQPLSSNDPNGSNGLSHWESGLRATPSTSNPVDATPTATQLNSVWSADLTALEPPVAPQDLTITNVLGSEIDMAWTEDPSNQTGFYVDRSTTSSGGFASIATLGATAASFSNTGLTSGTTYYYEVQAYNSYSTSAFSNIESATANGSSGLGAPSLSAAVDGTHNTSQIDLSWTDNNDASATGFNIDRSTASGGTYTQVATAGASATVYSDTGLTDGTAYFYEVQAFNSSTTSSFSNIANAATNLAAPSNLQAAVISPTEIDLSWIDNSTTATQYIVQQSTDGTSYTPIATLGATAVSYHNTGLSEGQTYDYLVAAGNASGGISSEVGANATTLVNAPSGLTATDISAGQIDLSWTDNDGGAAIGYQVLRSTTSTGFTLLYDTGTTGAGVHAYTDTHVLPSTTYYYEVLAYTADAESAPSSSANAATPTNEVGGIATDNYYGTNGSAWSSQWSFVTGGLTHGTAGVTLQNNQGQAVFTEVSGKTMSGNYVALNNSEDFVDSIQTVLFWADTTSTQIELVARSNTQETTFYYVHADLGTVGNNFGISRSVTGTATSLKKVTVSTLTTNTQYEIEFEVVTANSTTTDLYASIWATSGTEPTTWTDSTTDTNTHLQGISGEDGMQMNVAAATENTFTVDNYEEVNLISSNASFLDTFENSSTTGWTPLTASRWTVGLNNNSIRYYINTSSYTGGSGGSLGEYSLVSQSGYTNVGDFTVDLDVAAGSSTAGSNYAIVFGYQNSTNYYFMEFNATSGNTALYKVVSGTASVVASASGAWITDTNYHNVKITRLGNVISVFYDGNSVLTTTDATFIGGGDRHRRP